MKNSTENFGFKRKCGILMPVSALPSEYGIGSFGKSAYDFVDFLDAARQRVWQVLPLGPTAFGDSPYQSPASGAGNPYFIDLDILADRGLLTEQDLREERYSSEKIDYGRLFAVRYKTLRAAYSNFKESRAYLAFCKKNASWLDDYALFMSLKVHYNHASWTTWAKEHRDISEARSSALEFASELGFWKWVQFEFMTQWHALHKYARSKGISVIGDMPIYVAHDSMDVWRAPEEFLLNDDFSPAVVAGCPPDAYSETGQRWGNPIYNWERMRKDGFSWWIARAGAAFSMYDILRIDHFRGFASYYTIPAEAEDARSGEWRCAPGKELFDAVKAAYPKSKIIAEDLGYITDDVRELLACTGFPGMKVIQFAFYSKDSEYLPRMYTSDNCIVYTSTHDSDCTRTWFDTLEKTAKTVFKKECKRRPRQTGTDAAIELAMASRANLAVISMQDYLGLTSEEGRINVPSVDSGNWGWRIAHDYNTQKLRKKILAFAESSGRGK